MANALKPLRFCYADPPYPGQAKKHYSDDPSGIPAEEVNHERLIIHLEEMYDGWALSSNEQGLDIILPICAQFGWTLSNHEIRMGIWVKPFHVFKRNVNPSYGWEPIIFRGGRKRTREQPTLKNFVVANITLRKGTHGVKPPAVSRFIFEWLNFGPDDVFVDLFPGSGAVSDEFVLWRGERYGDCLEAA